SAVDDQQGTNDQRSKRLGRRGRPDWLGEDYPRGRRCHFLSGNETLEYRLVFIGVYPLCTLIGSLRGEPPDFCHCGPGLLLPVELAIAGSQEGVGLQIIGIADEDSLEGGNRLLVPPRQVIGMA